ncbi:MAG: DUF262 domain-containing protein [Acidobacteria bacterium]|nr:DUF262 domain-containing protein [Acidobacteriota bacterium]
MHADVGIVQEPAMDSAPGKPRPARVWVVRADGGKYTHHFVAGGYAGCSEKIDVASARSREEIRLRYEQADPDAGPKSTGTQVGQLASFLLDMHEGDYVITPEADREWLRYGRVAGPCVSLVGGDGCPFRNRRTVEWADTRLRRHDFSDSFQNTLGSLLAVFEVHQGGEFLATVERYRQERGVEDEREDLEPAAIARPFDPAKIKVRTVTIVVDQLVSRLRHDALDLAPDFQRMSGIWKPVNKSRLIESLLLRIPIPVFYVAADEEENWDVVDGVQRMSTMCDYVMGKFSLTGLEYRDEFNGKRYDELPRAMQRRISETQIVVNVIEPGTPAEVMFNIFHRINTGGQPLNGQEIRHALNPGLAREYLKELADFEEFAAATAHSISKDRMADRECVLRFLAFRMEPWEKYAANTLDSHLAAAMRAINAMSSPGRDSLASDFKKAMRAAERIFGNDAFRKRRRPDDYRNQISMPLFETWAVQLARSSPDEIERLVARREEVRNRFMDLLNEDAEFEKAISVSTGTPQRVRKRFTAIRDLVQEFV